MRHGFQIRYNGISLDVLSYCKSDLGLGPAERRSIDDIPNRHHAVLFIFYLDPDGRFARDRRFDTNAPCLHIQRNIVGKIGDPTYLYPYIRMYLIAGDRRSLGHVGHLSVDVEAVKRILQLGRLPAQISFAVHALPASRRALVQQIDRRELIRSRRRHGHVEIFFLQSALRRFCLRKLFFR